MSLLRQLLLRIRYGEQTAPANTRLILHAAGPGVFTHALKRSAKFKLQTPHF